MIKKGGTATYQRPSPSSASPRMFTRPRMLTQSTVLEFAGNAKTGTRKPGAASVDRQAQRIGQVFDLEIDRHRNHRHPLLAREPGLEGGQRHRFRVPIALRNIAAEFAQTNRRFL